MLLTRLGVFWRRTPILLISSEIFLVDGTRILDLQVPIRRAPRVVQQRKRLVDLIWTKLALEL